MIVLSVLAIFESIITSVLAAIPGPVVPGINSLATSVVSDSWFQHLGWANDYVPLSATLTAMGVVVTVWSGMWVIYIVIFLLEKFHILGGGD